MLPFRVPGMSIRHTLLGLTGFLGAALMTVVALQMVISLANWREMNQLVASNQLREELARAAVAIAAERSQVVLYLRGFDEAGLELATLRRESDEAIALAMSEVQTLSRAGQQGDLAALVQELSQHRVAVDNVSNADESAAVADAFYDFGVKAINRLNALRLMLRAREQPTDPPTALAFSLRAQTSGVYEYLTRSRILLASVAVGQAEDAAVQEIERNAVRIEEAFEVLRGNPELLGDDFPERVEALRLRYYSLYRPAERGVLAGEPRMDEVSAESSAMLDDLREFLDALFVASRDRLSDKRFGAAVSGWLWLGLFVLGGVAVIASNLVVRQRVLRPLGALNNAMLELAKGQHDTPLPDAPRSDEMRALFDALRVFKANALRRQRLQDERLALHERLKDAYRLLKVDLEAAAAVQTNLLPPSAHFGNVAFYSFFQPSRYIAGDTYDVVRRPDGRIDFFEIDVAGHGAPAALISVASHHSISQASLQRNAGNGLAELVAAINADWPESFPYFTMILGEIDPSAQRGRLVQAGHPPPLLIGRDGRVRALGDGGLPVGILRHATYDEIVFDFAPGDRLLLYSDGLVEAEDAEGRFFSQERLEELVRTHARISTPVLLDAINQALRSWRGSGTLDDDVTVLILEADTQDERA